MKDGMTYVGYVSTYCPWWAGRIRRFAEWLLRITAPFVTQTMTDFRGDIVAKRRIDQTWTR